MTDPAWWPLHWGPGSADQEVAFAAFDGAVAASLVERSGFEPVGDPVDLESMENRVFAVPVRDGTKVIKLYRPGRWSRSALLDEIAFVDALHAAGLPVLPPITHAEGRLGQHAGGWFTILEWVDGGVQNRSPLSGDAVRSFGALLGRLHTVGAERRAAHRPDWECSSSVRGSIATLQASGIVPPAALHEFAAQGEQLIAASEWLDALPRIRVHGDLTMGNVLWTESGPVIMDFDDFMNAPACQDLVLADCRYDVIDPDITVPPVGWTSERPNLDGHQAARRQIQELLLEGYATVAAVDRRWLDAAPLLHAMRTYWYEAWVVSRRHDVAFAEDVVGIEGAPWWDELIAAMQRRLGALEVSARRPGR